VIQSTLRFLKVGLASIVVNLPKLGSQVGSNFGMVASVVVIVDHV